MSEMKQQGNIYTSIYYGQHKIAKPLCLLLIYVIIEIEKRGPIFRLYVCLYVCYAVTVIRVCQLLRNLRIRLILTMPNDVCKRFLYFILSFKMETINARFQSIGRGALIRYKTSFKIFPYEKFLPDKKKTLHSFTTLMSSVI